MSERAMTVAAERLPLVAVIGAGTAGWAWARLFATHGYPVRIFDPRPDLADVVRAFTAEHVDLAPRMSRARRRNLSGTRRSCRRAPRRSWR